MVPEAVGASMSHEILYMCKHYSALSGANKQGGETSGSKQKGVIQQTCQVYTDEQIPLTYSEIKISIEIQ